MHELFVAFRIYILELQVYRQTTYTIDYPRFKIGRVAQFAVRPEACIGATHAVHPVAGTEGLPALGQPFDDDFVLAQFDRRM